MRLFTRLLVGAKQRPSKSQLPGGADSSVSATEAASPRLGEPVRSTCWSTETTIEMEVVAQAPVEMTTVEQMPAEDIATERADVLEDVEEGVENVLVVSDELLDTLPTYADRS